MSLMKRSNGLFPALSDTFGIDLFDSFFSGKNTERAMPAVNIRESDKEFTVEVAAPGLNKEDFEVNVDDNVLTISSHKETSTEEKDKGYTRKEFNYTSFSRSFTLPEGIKSEEISAKHENGVLYIALPKSEDYQKRKNVKQIEIR